MRNLKLLFLPIIFGLLTVAAVGQERQQEGQQEGQQERQMQERQMQERSIEVNDLPQPVKDRLQEDYEDWRATEASLSSDPEEGTFYKVKVQNTEDAQETKTLKIATDGEVIDEEEGKSKDKDKDKDRSQQRDGDRQYGPATQDMGQQERDQQGQGQYGQQDRGQQGQQGQHGQHHMQQERDVQVTDLPEDVQEKFRDDYQDWRPVSAEVGYKVTMSKMDNGDQKHKVLNISADGEVVDEEEIDQKEFRKQQDQQRRDGQQDQGQQQRGQQDQGQQDQGQQQHMEGMTMQVTDLPEDVQEKFRDEYEGWRPVSAERTYKVTMSKMDNGDQKHKVVNITTDGEVIDEEEIDQKEFRKQQDQRRQQDQQRRDGQQDRQYDGQQQRDGDRQYTPAAQQDMGQQERERQQQDGQQHQEGRQQQDGQQHQEGRQQQQQQLKVTDLPKDVQETLREDYEDWQPVDVQITTDREVYEEGSFYKVRMNKTDNGERETKIVKIARDGEVIDEEEVDDEELERSEKRHRDGRQR